MAEAIAGVAYAAETVAEGAYALTKAIYNPTAPLKATFRKLKAPSIPRSSHTVSVVKGRAYLFGGELQARRPVSNDVEVLTLPSIVLNQTTDHINVPAKASKSNGEVPAARVGHSAAVVGDHVLVFGGRGGKEMKALEERGRVWAFDTKTHTWTYLDPNASSPVPEARSYHASTATEHPLPPTNTPNVTNVLMDEPPTSTKDLPGPPVPLTYGTLFVHAGCLSSGGRTGDLWAFDISSRSWAQLPGAPNPPRGGTSMALVKDRIYRFGGFDGTRELGGEVDWIDLVSGTFDDKAGQGEMALAASSKGWQKDIFAVGSDNKGGPTNRSVAGLVPVNTGQGRNYLAIVCGETDPSNKGHDGAGKFLDDVWSYQLKPEGATAASTKDAIKGPLLGKDTGEREAYEVKYYDEDGRLIQESQPKPMCGRGWFGAAAVTDLGEAPTALVWGGLDESNTRLGDGWLISFE